MSLALLTLGVTLLLSYAVGVVPTLVPGPLPRNRRVMHVGPRVREAHLQRVLTARRERAQMSVTGEAA